MDKENPEIHRETGPNGPEATQADYEQLAQRRSFSTEREKDRIKDGVDNITRIGQKETPIPEFETATVHNEANIPLKNEYTNPEEIKQVLGLLISTGKDPKTGKKLSPHQLNMLMSQAQDENNEFEKAA